VPGLNTKRSLQRTGDDRRVVGQIDTIDVTWSLQRDNKLFIYASGMSRKYEDPIAEACSFTDIVCDKNDRLFPLLPDLLNVRVELFACECVERYTFFGGENSGVA
jgi:hypothetical protein